MTKVKLNEIIKADLSKVKKIDLSSKESILRFNKVAKNQLESKNNKRIDWLKLLIFRIK